MKRLIVSITTLLLAGSSFAQQVQPCGTDQNNKELIQANPSMQLQQQQFDNGLKEYMKTYDQNQTKALQKLGKAGAPQYIIPVVVHVFHQNGSENISDAQIQSEITQLNKSFRKLNSDTGNVRAIFKDIAADAQIEFRLAKKDPQGNCTNGIVRYYTPLTNKGNDELKKLSVWDSKRYYNLWVVGAINKGPGVGVAGYAQFPFGNGEFSASTDGVMVIHNEFGNIGTSQPGQTVNVTTTTHESGHWLGLYHPFQGDSCDNEGDGISETPTTYFIASTTEPLRNRCNNPTFNSCATDNPDLPDMQENFMDYFIGSCASNMFTLQQAARMHYVLNNYRNDLWSPANLAATGVDGSVTGTCAPIPSISTTSTGKSVCLNTSVSFKDNTYNGTVTSWSWNFGEGANPATSTTQNPSVQWTTPGWKTITLTSTNANGSTTKTFEKYIYVQPASEVNGAGSGVYYADWDYINDFLNRGWTFDNETPAAKWIRTDRASYSGGYSIYLDKSSTEYGFSYSLISPTFNFTGATKPYMSFYYSFANNFTGAASTDISKDIMQLYVSTDCGKTWLLRKTVNSTSNPKLSTNVATLRSVDDYAPVNQSQWRKDGLEGSSVASASDWGSLRFKITFTNQGGNNFYLDELQVGVSSGIEDHKTAEDYKFHVYPNPFNTATVMTFETTEKQNIQITVSDITGKQVAVLANDMFNAGSQQFSLDRQAAGMKPGLYFVNVKIGSSNFTQKLMVN